MRWLRLVSLGACLGGLLGCGPNQSTQRVYHGRLVAGPYVEPEAYAAFAEGVYLEARGDWDGARSAYRRARSRDPDSPGIAARLGALACRTSLEAALEELETDGIARDYAPAWAERARCLLAHRDPARALEAAYRAVMLEPGNPEANLAIAQIHREQGRPELARAWLFAWLLDDPDAAAHRDALGEQATLLGDASLARLVAERRRPDPDEPAGADAHALSRPSERAREALRRGEPGVAGRHAALALDANPADADAVVLALLAASLEPDDARFADVLRRAQVSATPPDPASARGMAELLRARVGDDAAERWLAALRRVSPPQR